MPIFSSSRANTLCTNARRSSAVIVGTDLQRAADRPAIGMTGECGRPPALVREIVRARGGAAQPRERLLAHSLDIDRSNRGAVSASRSNSAASSWFSVSVRSEPADVVAGRREAASRSPWPRAARGRSWNSISPAPFVEQRRRHRGDAGLVDRVLGGAAAEGEIERDQRHRRLTDQPSLDAAGLTMRSIVVASAAEGAAASASATANAADSARGKDSGEDDMSACVHGCCSWAGGSSLTR